MSADRFVLHRIRALPLFERLAPEQVPLAAGQFEVMRFSPGAVVFAQGQPTQGFYLLASGRGILTTVDPSGAQSILAHIEPGQYLNESALYRETHERASLHIVEEAILLFLSRRRFIALLTQHPEIRANLRVLASTAPPVGHATQSIPSVTNALAAAAVGMPNERRATQERPGVQTTPIMGVPGVEQPRQPGKTLFKGQRETETVMRIYRPHFWSFARYLWIPFLIAVGGLLGGLFAGSAASGLGLSIMGLGIVVAGAIIAYQVWEWRNDSIILTDQRVVRVWNNLFPMERTINEIPLERVLEVNYEIPPADPFAPLFDYGIIYVKTAGEAANFTLPMMPHPKALQTAIFAQRDLLKQDAESRDKERIRQEIQRAMGVPPTDAEIRAQTAQSQVDQNAAHSKQIATHGPPLVRTKFSAQNGDIYYRRHLSVWLAHVFVPLLIVFAAFPILFLALFSPEFPLYGWIGLGVSAFTFFAGGFWMYLADWDWRNDILILSDETITLTHKRPLFLQNEVQRIRLAQVDNVLSDVTGIFNNLLNKGDVKISLIGSAERKVFDNVYDPQEIQSDISGRQAVFKARVSSTALDAQRQAMAEYLAVYHESMQATTAPQQSIAPPGMTFNPAGNPPASPSIAAQAFSSAATMPAAYPVQSQRPESSPRLESSPMPSTMPMLTGQNTATVNGAPHNLPEADAADGTSALPVRDGLRPPRVPRIRPQDLPE